jgi:transposase
MPSITLLEIPLEEQAQMLVALRRARYGYLLALQVLLRCAAKRTPSEIAACLFCSRSRVYRIVMAYRTGTLGWEYAAEGTIGPPVRTTVLPPSLKRSLLALLKAAPRASGWCRTRWSCATLAGTWHAKRGITVLAETVRRWVHEVGWVWKRAKLVAQDDDPQRAERLARIRGVFEPLQAWERLVFADELDIPLLPKVGYAWMPKGVQVEGMTPGQNEKPSLAGALDVVTGRLRHCLGARKTHAWFRDLLGVLDTTYPPTQFQRLSVGGDNYKIHTAKAVEQWLERHPRLTLLFLPTYGPRANPLARAFGDIHDKCPRNHTRKRLPELVGDVQQHGQVNGPWPYQRSPLYYEPDVTAAMEKLATIEQLQAAA